MENTALFSDHDEVACNFFEIVGKRKMCRDSVCRSRESRSSKIALGLLNSCIWLKYIFGGEWWGPEGLRALGEATSDDTSSGSTNGKPFPLVERCLRPFRGTCFFKHCSMLCSRVSGLSPVPSDDNKFSMTLPGSHGWKRESSDCWSIAFPYPYVIGGFRVFRGEIQLRKPSYFASGT